MVNVSKIRAALLPDWRNKNRKVSKYGDKSIGKRTKLEYNNTGKRTKWCGGILC